MEKEIGDKLCSFYIDDDGEHCVAITFPRAKIFKPQADGNIQIFQGPRTINHTALSLRALIESCKAPGDLPLIERSLQDYIKESQ